LRKLTNVSSELCPVDESLPARLKSHRVESAVLPELIPSLLENRLK
jgi:hypothetical protein